MLKTVTLTQNFKTGTPCVMLLGGFDGLHAGHKTLISRAKEYRLPIGIMCIVGGKTGESLFTVSERETIFKDAEIDFIFELPFSEIRDLTPEQFCGLLQKEFTVKAFVCGDDFRFGKGALGTAETIKRATQVCVDVLPLVTADGEKISSSNIKILLKEGKVEMAQTLLGSPFFLVGEVIKDRQIGRTLGFPTANIVYPKDKYPLRKGVYETRVFVDGKEYKGITNYGARPTFENERVITETYLDGFSGDLYGKTLKISFVRYLRDVQKFNDAEELKAQLQKDIRRVKGYD